MKILVCVKRVIDFKTAIRVKSDESGVETAHVKMSMNPFDEIAVEEAIRLKEQGHAHEIVAVSIGNESCQETIRTALAMGADRGVLIKTEANLEPLAIAKTLKTLIQQEQPQLVLMGKQAIDHDHNQTGQMLAALLNWPQGTFVSKILFHDNKIEVTREVDGGLETLLLTLPAIITTDLRLNEPRYISLPNIVQAKRKSIKVLPLEDFNIEITSQVKVLRVQTPEKRRAGIKVESVSELVRLLKEEARII